MAPGPRTKGDSDVQVVDDSEPEREEQRKRERVRKKKEKGEYFAHLPTNSPSEHVDEVARFGDMQSRVELNSDVRVSADARLTRSPVSPMPIQTVLELTTSEITPLQHGDPRRIEGVTTNASQKGLERRTQLIPIPPPNPVDVLLNPTIATPGLLSDNEDDDIKGNLNITRFAYKRSLSKSTQPEAGSSRAASAVVVDPILSKCLGRGAGHRFATTFSDDELAKLLKCISCDIHWTTRKSATQKMVHIQSCAKKKAFTDDTIIVLIRNEINATYNPVKGKGKKLAAKTFFEEVVEDAASKKKGKRKEVVETVQSVAVTRASILDKARIILGPEAHLASASWSGGFSVKTQAIGARSIDNSFSKSYAPPSTQAFAQSALARRQTPTNSLFSAEVLAADIDTMIPPATQPFAPSKLGITAGNSLTAVSMSSIPSHSDIINQPITDPSSHPLTHIIAFDIFSAKEPSLPHSRLCLENGEVLSRLQNNIASTSTLVPNVHEQLDDFAWQTDDAYLHFDPLISGHSQHEAQLSPPIHAEVASLRATDNVATQRTEVSKYPSKLDTSSGSESSLSRPRTKAKEKQPKAKTKSKQKDDEIDPETWGIWMKDKILQDEALHLRVLRYEPIHFNVFVELAGNDWSRGLKLRLRSFLDKQAISFYGMDGPSGRRR